MTDLEDLWNDLPVGPAPVEDILRQARGRGIPDQHARRLRRSSYAAATAAAVAAAFVAGSLAAQHGGPPSAVPDPVTGAAPDAVPVAFHGALQTPASCDALLAHYVDRAVALVGPSGWVPVRSPEARAYGGYDGIRGPYNSPAFNGLAMGNLDEQKTAGAMPRGGYAPTTQRSVPSASGTNVQEAGVDEPDIVKTDGHVLVRIREQMLTVYDVSGRSVRWLGDLDVSSLDPTGDASLLLAGDHVVVLATSDTRTRVGTVDLADPAHPRLASTVDYGAPLVAARQSGDVVRLVLASTALPHLDFTHPDDHTSQEEAKAANVAVVRHSSLADWLPQVRADGHTRALLDCAHVALPRADLGLGTMAVVGFDAATPTRPSAFGLAGTATTTYESTDHLYLAAAPSTYAVCNGCLQPLSSTYPHGVAAVEDPGVTHLYDFALDGSGATYAAAGEVDGVVTDRWSMDEVDGVLRVAVGPSVRTGDFTSVVTLHRKGDQLLELGRLDGLGRGEQMESVRWFDGLALLVTYRQRDPLYAVDLTDQAHPRLLGELSLRGYSSYLQPLGAHRVIGMGLGPVQDGRWGARAGLFDTTDPAHLVTLDRVDYQPGSRPLAAEDPRQFTWLPRERVALTVVARGRTGFVSTLHLDGAGHLEEHRVAAEYGPDIPALRLVAVPGPAGGDRVVLVTGGKVSFFSLGLR